MSKKELWSKIREELNDKTMMAITTPVIVNGPHVKYRPITDDQGENDA